LAWFEEEWSYLKPERRRRSGKQELEKEFEFVGLLKIPVR